MSEDTQSQSADTAGAVIRARAAEWVIARREHGGWTGESQKALDAWLAQSPAHQIAYLRINSAWDRADRLVALTPVGRRSIWEHARPLMMRGAAGCAALAIVGVVWVSLLPKMPEAKVYSTTAGNRATISLNDGSQIELNTDTTLRLATGHNQSTVWLDEGEAYFSIKHNESRPFSVVVNGHRIVDLGTKFLVRRQDATVRVALMDGSLRFDPGKDGTRSTTLKPGDVLIANANRVRVTREPVTRLTNEIGWRNDLVIFEHTTLAEAVAEINRYGRKKLVVADPEIGVRKISGAFPATNSELFARAARSALDLKIEDRGDEIVFHRNGK